MSTTPRRSTLTVFEQQRAELVREIAVVSNSALDKTQKSLHHATVQVLILLISSMGWSHSIQYNTDGTDRVWSKYFKTSTD